MNKSAFLHIIRNASAITAGEAEELEELIVNFPYCQTAHLLVAKAAYDRGSMLANQKLRKAAAYATNRQLLRKLVYAPAPAVSVPETIIASFAPITEPVLVSAPEEEVLAYPEEDPETLDFQAEEAGVAFFSEEEETPGENVKEGEETPFIVAPLDGYLSGNSKADEESSTLSSPDEVETEDDLDGLLYIDRIFPFRHVLPEHLPAPPAGLPGEDPGSFAISEYTSHIPSLPSGSYPSPLLADPESDPALVQLLLETAETDAVYPATQTERETLTATEDLAEEPVDWQEEEKPTEAAAATEEKPAEAEQPAPDRIAPEILSINSGALDPEAPAEPKTPEQNNNEPTFADDIIAQIYAQNQLGYSMGSSRLGECLEVKNDLSTDRPFHFYPDLILEYVQEHEEVEMQQPAPVDSVLDVQINLINQFLKLSPRLKQFAETRVRSEPQEDLSLKSGKIKKSLASENLATIFLKQGKVKKAIKIYEHLITKFPEKKAYFADQIEKLKQHT